MPEKVPAPSPTETERPKWISCLMVWMARQNRDPTRVWQARRGLPRRYFFLISCSQRLPSSLSMRHTYLSIKVHSYGGRQWSPGPPSGLGKHMFAHLTIWYLGLASAPCQKKRASTSREKLSYGVPKKALLAWAPNTNNIVPMITIIDGVGNPRQLYRGLFVAF